MQPSPTLDPNAVRVREIAGRLNALTDEDFALLAGVKPETTHAWRGRGLGPAYVLLGNNYFYPLDAVSNFMQTKLRARNRTIEGAL